MNNQRSLPQATSIEAPTIRFAGDADLTFVNYDPRNEGNFAYRREARLHNARRRQWRSTQVQLPARQGRELRPSTRQQPIALVGPLSSLRRDPFSQDVLTSRQALERTWRTVFPSYFYLPILDVIPPGFPDPISAFLSAAQQGPDLYRSLVVDAVMTNRAMRGTQANEAVLQNQALILRDFRRLFDIYNLPSMNISREQFQHVFATAFSLTGPGFNKEAGYNAILFVNSLLMADPRNHATLQYPTTEWMRMLMHLPGPSFHRSQAYQSEMLRKVSLVVKFIDQIQTRLSENFSPLVLRYARPDTSIYRILTLDIPVEMMSEPYKHFYKVCRHRMLSLLYRWFDRIDANELEREDNVLSRIAALASTCLQFPPQQCIALFLWCLISNSEATGQHNDHEEPFFSWALKELITIHDIPFDDKLAIWILHKCSTDDSNSLPYVNIADLRDNMQAYYEGNTINTESAEATLRPIE